MAFADILDAFRSLPQTRQLVIGCFIVWQWLNLVERFKKKEQRSKAIQSSKVIRAICQLRPDGNSGVHGIVKLVGGANKPTKIVAELWGLSKGKHGFHIHEFGDLTEGCKTAGGHYNPFNYTHGSPTDGEGKRHVGDLGNIIAHDENEMATFELTDSQVRLCGPYSVIGRAFVVHAGEDDLGRGGNEDSLKTGNAGGRLACGTIGLAK